MRKLNVMPILKIKKTFGTDRKKEWLVQLDEWDTIEKVVKTIKRSEINQSTKSLLIMDFQNPEGEIYLDWSKDEN